jgi:hypothetical protein
VADAPSLEQLWRRAVDAQLRYYRSVGQLSIEYARAVLGAVRAARPAQPTPTSAPPTPALPAAAPVLALEAEEGSWAVGMFVVENGTGTRVSAPVDLPVLADAEGRQVHGEVRFEPEVVTLEPGEQTLVQIAVEVTRGLRRGVDYRGEVSVPGLTGTRIPLVVRRVAAPAQARKRAPRSRAKASK